MPNLVSVSKMKLRKVYLILTKLPNSYYRGLQLNEIVKKISKAEAYRYICELSLINSIAKSHLVRISELGSEEDSASIYNNEGLRKRLSNNSLMFNQDLNQNADRVLCRQAVLIRSEGANENISVSQFMQMRPWKSVANNKNQAISLDNQ